MENDFIISLIIGITWIIGLIGSFVLAYVITKYDQKTNPSKTYTYASVIDTQYNIGGPLALFPILNFFLLIYCTILYILDRKKYKFFK